MYRGSELHGEVVALLALGNVLMSLTSAGMLVTWELGEYEKPKVWTVIVPLL